MPSCQILLRDLAAFRVAPFTLGRHILGQIEWNDTLIWYIYIYICVCVCMYVCVCGIIHMWTSNESTSTQSFTHPPTERERERYIHTHTYIYIYNHIYIYIWICIFMLIERQRKRDRYTEKPTRTSNCVIICKSLGPKGRAYAWVPQLVDFTARCPCLNQGLTSNGSLGNEHEAAGFSVFASWFLTCKGL